MRWEEWGAGLTLHLKNILCHFHFLIFLFIGGGSAEYKLTLHEDNVVCSIFYITTTTVKAANTYFQVYLLLCPLYPAEQYHQPVCPQTYTDVHAHKCRVNV